MHQDWRYPRRRAAGAIPLAVVFVAIAGSTAAVLAADPRVAPTADFSRPEPYEVQSAGAGTVDNLSPEALMHGAENQTFSRHLLNLSPEEIDRFDRGNKLFRRDWVARGGDATEAVGLGPAFNAPSCIACHVNDGRALPPLQPDEMAVGLLMRLLQPPEDEEQKRLIRAGEITRPGDPVYGSQLQIQAVGGMPPEGRLVVNYRDRPIQLGDGTKITLREPVYTVEDLPAGAMSDKTILSARVAPQMVGLGLLQAIDPADIVARADPEDRDNDGISGVAPMVRNPRTGQIELGRFGWRGEAATVEHQSAGAFANDIGISTSLRPNSWGDCTAEQADCRALAGDGDPEANEEVLALIAFYSASLAVPARRDVASPLVLAGKRLFYEVGCTGCHTPKYVTAADAAYVQLRSQLIWPYTDLLLHDMGPGLADLPVDPHGYTEEHNVANVLGNTAPEPDPALYEWKTPPLWGIGLTEIVSGRTSFLHDGRARNLTEAILWHGGEAKPARDGFAALTAEERATLLAFLNSL